MAIKEWKITKSEAGQRVDICLRRLFPDMAPQVLRACFQRRDVKLDGLRVKQDTRVAFGQTLAIYYMDTDQAPVDVVYEDGDVLLVNKRAGISVEADEKGGASLTELALRHVRLANPAAQAPVPCHRLDNKTCGLVLFAKNPKAEAVLVQAFRDRTMDKRYICLVKGTMKPPAATCRAYLKKNPQAARVQVFDREVPGSRPIITGYETLETLAGGSVTRLEVHLITGRTHQIRAHMAALGHPLLGDDVYGDRSFNRLQHARRLMLCAVSMTIETGGQLPQLDGRRFTIPCPF